MAGCGCEVEIKDREQGKILIVLLAINAVMFAVELGAGLWADSSGLIADAFDMLADALVYAVALYAVGRHHGIKINAARLSGMFQILLGLGVAADIIRRIFMGSEPQSAFMIGVGAIALVANVICVMLIAKQREGEIHMRASWIFSKNDVIANMGVIIGGLLVLWLGSAWPDLVIGAAIAALVTRGGIAILKDARRETASSCCGSDG